jgi:hypothetical protein
MYSLRSGEWVCRIFNLISVREKRRKQIKNLVTIPSPVIPSLKNAEIAGIFY